MGQTSDIASLQEKLLKSLNSVFDPTIPAKSDEDFLTANDDYSAGTNSDKYFEEYKNPYQHLAEKAKAYVKQKEVEISKKPVNTSKKTVAKKDLDTFLTGVGLEGAQRKESASPVEHEQEQENEPLPELDYKDVLGSANEAGEYDDLAELRRMIKNTKREMKDYGRELLDLKNIISDMNDFASKELGYSANHDLMRNMEATLNDLGQGKTFKKILKKNQSSAKNLKAPLPSTTTNTEKIPLPKTNVVVSKSIIKPATSNNYLGQRNSKSGIESFSGRLKKF